MKCSSCETEIQTSDVKVNDIYTPESGVSELDILITCPNEACGRVLNSFVPVSDFQEI